MISKRAAGRDGKVVVGASARKCLVRLASLGLQADQVCRVRCEQAACTPTERESAREAATLVEV